MKNTAIGKNRFHWIDNAKAIGIILVIIGHAFRDEMRINLILYDYIYSAIYFFHMPLFFALSGFLLENSFRKNESKLKMISKKIKTVFVPFVSYTLIIYFVFKLASIIPAIGNAIEGKGEINFFRYLFLSFVGDNPYSFHLWFLISLFIAEVIGIILRSQKSIGGGYILVIGIVLYLWPWSVFPSDLGYHVMVYSALKQDFVFLVLGQVLYNKEKLLSYKSTYLSAALICGLAMFALSYHCDFDSTKLYTTVLLNIIRFVGQASLIYFIIGMSHKIGEIKWMSYLGEKSFVIYLLHQPFFCGFLGMVLYNILGWPSFLVILICFIASLAAPLLFDCIVNKNIKIHKISKLLFNI